MPKLDEAKERLGLLKFYIGFFMTAFAALVSWIATHYKNFDDAIIFYGACGVAVVLFICINLCTNHGKKKLKEIRDLNKYEDKII